MAKIKRIYAYEVIDSHSIPTLEGILELDNGLIVSSSVPTNLKANKNEAVELRDNDFNRFNGLGLKTAVSYINDAISQRLLNVDPLKLQAIDNWLIKADGTKNKSNLGVNTILLISQLVAKAAAASLNLPLFHFFNQYYNQLFKESIKIERIPAPIFNMINGGKHANNNLEIQEFQIIPSTGFEFQKSYQLAVEVFNQLKEIITQYAANTAVGDEGSFTPNLSTNIDALEIIYETLMKKNLKIGIDVFFGLDIAADKFFKDGHYYLKEKPKPLTNNDLINYLTALFKKYNFLAIEDPFAQDDWTGWKNFYQKIGEEVYIIGDDLIVGNEERLKKAIKDNACNSISIKPNQIGTITETLKLINLAKKNNFSVIISHRAGDTNDTLLADLAVGIQADFVKFGAPCRGERVVKYNRLLQIAVDGFK